MWNRGPFFWRRVINLWHLTLLADMKHSIILICDSLRSSRKRKSVHDWETKLCIYLNQRFPQGTSNMKTTRRLLFSINWHSDMNNHDSCFQIVQISLHCKSYFCNICHLFIQTDYFTLSHFIIRNCLQLVYFIFTFGLQEGTILILLTLIKATIYCF